MEPVQPLQMNIYQSNTYRKDLSKLHFDDQPRVQDSQQERNQQSYISVFVACPPFQVATRSNNPDMTIVFGTWPYSRFIVIPSNIRRKKLHRTNQGSNLLGGSSSSRDNVRAPI